MFVAGDDLLQDAAHVTAADVFHGTYRVHKDGAGVMSAHMIPISCKVRT